MYEWLADETMSTQKKEVLNSLKLCRNRKKMKGKYEIKQIA